MLTANYHSKHVDTCTRLYKSYENCLKYKEQNKKKECNIILNKFFLNECQYLDEFANKKYNYFTNELPGFLY